MTQTIKIKRSTGSSAPSTLAQGELAYSKGTSRLYVGDPAAANTPLDIVDLWIKDSDNTLTLGADMSAATFKITNLGTPTATGDAATKGYVDSVAGVSALGDLTDVTLTSITDGEILVYDTTSPTGWINQTLSEAGIQPADADLTTIAGLSNADGNFIVGSGSAWVVESGDTARVSLGVGTTDSPTFAGVTADSIQVGVTGANEIDTSSGNLTIDSAGGTVTVDDNLVVVGDLTVQGTTTTVDSTVVTVEDPIFTLGGTGSPTANDGKDRGIEFHYNTGSGDTLGFFGYDISAGKFTFIPDATNASEVFSGTAGTILANFEVSSSFTIGGHALDDVNIAGEFTDADDTLMTAAAIDDRILSYGYTTNTGTVTSVDITAGTLIDKTGSAITSSGSIQIDVDLSEAAEAVYAPATDYLLFLDGGATGTAAKESGADFAAALAGTGLTAASGVMALDFSELTDMTGDIAGTTEFIVQDGTTESRKAASEIKLSFFNNDSGWTSNTGDITAITLQNASGESVADTSILFGSGTPGNTSTTSSGDATFVLRVGTIDGGTY